MNPAARVRADPAALADRIRRLVAARARDSAERVIIGIAGAPGAGKSTLAEAVIRAYGAGAVLIGMDGFHLAQCVLDGLGLAGVKGAPQTFDAAGYLSLLQRLRTPQPGVTVYAPEFRRAIEEPIAGAVAVPPTAEVVLTEGNYLLLTAEPWPQVRAQLTEAWFLDTPHPERIDRLVRRHVQFGRPPAVARERAQLGSDARNALQVYEAHDRADLLLESINRPTPTS